MATSNAGQARRDEFAERTGTAPREAAFPTTPEELRRAPLSVWQDFAEEDREGYDKLRDQLLYDTVNATDRRRR